MVKDATRAAEIISRTRLLFKKGTPQSELVNMNDSYSRDACINGRRHVAALNCRPDGTRG